MDCTFVRSDQTYRDYPVYKCPTSDMMIYLREDDYFGFADDFYEGAGPAIWLLKTTNSTCITDNTDPFGFWNVDENGENGFADAGL